MVWHFSSIALVMNGIVHAYPTPVDFSGKLLRWNLTPQSEELEIHVEGDASLSAIVEEAAQKWTDVETSFIRLRVLENGKRNITVHFSDGIDDAPFAAAYAEFDELDSKGHPVHCQIHVDSQQSELDKTVLHELGHCLGLGHSLIADSIMSYQNELPSADLDSDDAAAVSRLYPEDGSRPQLPQGCAIQKANRQLAPPIMMIPIVFLIFFGKRRRRVKYENSLEFPTDLQK